MQERLKTAFTHKLLTSPIGALLSSKFFEKMKHKSLLSEVRIAKAGATATQTSDVDEFVELLGIDETQISPRIRSKICEALANFHENWKECKDIQKQWEDAFWGTKIHYTEWKKVELENERRRKTEECLKPTKLFGFLKKETSFQAIQFNIPEPDEFFKRWSSELQNPSNVFQAPETMPEVECSNKVPGPSGSEYLLRFKSPSQFTRDVAYARIYEPEGETKEVATFIYGSGFLMMYDQIKYWPEEEYIGRELANKGIRAILIESPWHGRRTPPGFISGELYINSAPESLFQLYAAQAQDTAVMIQWARAMGSPRVGVGGINLGGLVAQQIAGRCGAWPEEMRPDMVFLGAVSNQIPQVIIKGELCQLLGLIDAVKEAGWTDTDLDRVRVLLDPPSDIGISPGRIIAVLGKKDSYLPYRFAVNMLKEWRVPEKNIKSWDLGHFGLLTRCIRKLDIQNMIAEFLRHQHGSINPSPFTTRF